MSFLERNPSETIIVSLKREGVGSSTDAHLSQILAKHYIGPHREMWYTDTKIPYLAPCVGNWCFYAATLSILPLPHHHHHHHAPHPANQSILRRQKPTASTPQPGRTTARTPSTAPLCVQDYCEILLPTSHRAETHLQQRAPLPRSFHHSTHPGNQYGYHESCAPGIDLLELSERQQFLECGVLAG